MYKRDRGFLDLSLLGWAAVGAFLLILGLSVALKVQSSRLEAVQAEYTVFKSEVKRLGEEAERKTKEQIARDIKEKERRDADYKSRIARLERDNKRLRDNPPSSFLPPAAPGSASPDRAQIDRAEFDRAFLEFRTEILGITTEGDKAVIGLDSLK